MIVDATIQKPNSAFWINTAAFCHEYSHKDVVSEFLLHLKTEILETNVLYYSKQSGDIRETNITFEFQKNHLML
jgi:hypothetical protein